ncbi:MAG: hypothetical protein HKN59_04885, partial [Gammaproteobacteria bacterium]|nr:hypothetical protein [Gammaproteobacteria bacterium]
GASRDIFTPGAVREVHRLSEGVPRLINVICDRALLGAYGQEKAMVDTRLARQAASEVQGKAISAPGMRWVRPAAAVLVMAVLGSAAYYYWMQGMPGDKARVEIDAASEAEPARQAHIPEQRAPATPESAALAVQPDLTIADTVAGSEISQIYDLGDLLGTSKELTDNNTAFAELFRLWDKAFVPGSTRACTQAAAQRLKCLFQRGSWNHLITLNLPAILSLTDVNGDDHQVVLTQILDEQHVVLQIGGSSYPVLASDLNALWFGDSLLLWRPHEGADRLLGPGARGEGVRWLREGLGKLTGISFPSSPDPALYDESLSEQVRKFQRDYGLRVDGIAGERTLVKLQVLLRETGMPLLSQDS